MRVINKDKEPKEWLIYRKTPGVSFASIPGLKKSLLQEQGHLCAYCMRRIDENNMKVEHIKPRKYENLVFEYRNLLACCLGEVNGNRFCDTNKGETEIMINPFSEADIQTISYSSKTGEIKSSDDNFSKDINETLNLNFGMLKSNRKQCLDGLIECLGKTQWSKKQIQDQYRKYADKNSDGKYFEYNGIILWYLERKLKQI